MVSKQKHNKIGGNSGSQARQNSGNFFGKHPITSCTISIFILPLLGLLFSFLVHNGYNYEIKQELLKREPDKSEQIQRLDYITLCSSPEFLLSNSVEFCQDAFLIWLIGGTVWFCIYLNVFVLISLLGFYIISKLSRKAFVYVFRLGYPLAVIVMNILLLTSAILFMGILYLAQIFIIGGYALFFTILIIGGTVVGYITAIRLQIIARKMSFEKVSAILVTPKQQKKLFASISKVANELNSPVPETVLIGIMPEFFVTEAELDLGSNKTNGLTLYVSLSLARILSVSEFEAVLAHELSHFTGNDTAYSTKFAPAYSYALRRTTALSIASRQTIYALPLAFSSTFFMACFIHLATKANGRYARVRELAADNSALKIGTAKALASTLVKLGFSQAVWQETKTKIFNSIRSGKKVTSVSRVFKEQTLKFKKTTDSKKLPEHTHHPYDTHPGLKTRLDFLEVPVDQAVEEANKVLISTCILLINKPDDLEKELINDVLKPIIDLVETEKSLEDIGIKRDYSSHI